MATEILRATALAAVATSTALLCGCTMGPNFHRQETTPPPTWAGAASAPADLPSNTPPDGPIPYSRLSPTSGR